MHASFSELKIIILFFSFHKDWKEEEVVCTSYIQPIRG